MSNNRLPKKYRDLVGTKQFMSGGLFSHKRSEPEKEYDVLDIRWGSATIMSITELREGKQPSYEYPTFELLVKREGMAKSRWTRPFPIREINLRKKRSKKKPSATL
jgi:hypothetical protein